MVRVYEFKAPESLKLNELSTREAEHVAAELANRALETLGDIRPVGVNAVSMGQIVSDTEVWVQWTRACCDKRASIEDFTDPVVNEFDVPSTPLPVRMHGTHIESQMRTVRLEGPDHVG